MISNWPLYGVVLFSWVIALAEYNKTENPTGDLTLHVSIYNNV